MLKSSNQKNQKHACPSYISWLLFGARRNIHTSNDISDTQILSHSLGNVHVPGLDFVFVVRPGSSDGMTRRSDSAADSGARQCLVLG